MKVELKKLPKSEVELTITVPYADYKKYEKKAIEGIGKKIKVSGFRSGHIPENIVRKEVTDEAVKMATLDCIFPQTYAKAVKENKVAAIARPEVDIKSDVEKDGDDFIYVAKVAVMPEVKLGDYKKIKVTKELAKVTNKSVKETIDMIMSRFAEWQGVDRKVKEGDRVEVDFEGFDEQGVSIPNTASKNHPIIIGSKTMIPGFEKEMIGLKKGEEKVFDITFPKDYHAENMMGKKVKFKITLNRLEEKKKQKLDADMIKKITGKEWTVDDFKKSVEEDLIKEKGRDNKQKFENEVVEKLIKIAVIEVPQAMIDEEIDHMINEQKGRLSQQGMNWENFLKHSKKTEEEVKKDYAIISEDRIKARLIMQEIIKKEAIKVADEEVRAKIDEMIKGYPKEQRSKIEDHYKKDPEAMRFIENTLLADKLFKLFIK